MTQVPTDERPMPLMPTDVEIDGMQKAALLKVVESHGLPVNDKMTAKELRPWARALVHGARNVVEAAAEVVVPPPPAPTVDETPPVAAPDAEVPPVDAHAAVYADAVQLEVPSATTFDLSQWEMIQSLAEYFFRAGLRPLALKTKEDVGIVLLAAHELGIPKSQAMQLIHVQNGRLGMQGELMSAVILRDGHEIRPDPGNDATYAKVYGRRAGTDEWQWAEFTIQDAEQAGLVYRDNGGQIIARSENGKKLPWELYTADMLYWRALSRLARRIFPDSLRGVSYTPDELGWIPGEVADELETGGRKMGRAGESEPTMTFNQQRDEIAHRLHDLPEDLQKEVAEKWKAHLIPPLAHKDFKAAALKTVRGWIEAAEVIVETREAESTAHIPDAEEVVEQTDGSEEAGSGSPDRDAPEPAPASASDTDESVGTDLSTVAGTTEPADGASRGVEQESDGPATTAARGDGDDGAGHGADDEPGTGPQTATPSDSAPDPEALFCASCLQQITEVPVIADSPIGLVPYHPDCAPM